MLWYPESSRDPTKARNGRSGPGLGRKSILRVSIGLGWGTLTFEVEVPHFGLQIFGQATGTSQEGRCRRRAIWPSGGCDVPQRG